MIPERVRLLKEGRLKGEIILYWMSRDQRVQDNWSLVFASQLAKENQMKLGVVFILVPEFQGAAMRQYGFMLQGLQEVELKLVDRNIPFFLLQGEPGEVLPDFLNSVDCAALVCDFDPLKIKRAWKKEIGDHLEIPLYEVDSHNIVPARTTSDKTEFAAYTIRPKIKRKLEYFLDAFPELPSRSSGANQNEKVDWDQVRSGLKADESVPEVDWLIPGEAAAQKQLEDFIHNRLSKYRDQRNDPNRDAASHLSPYLHFGQISAQRITIEVIKSGQDQEAVDAFLEELIIRRELSDNFCFYNPDYDNFKGFPDWARNSLNEHRKDEREYLYERHEFEEGKTHDPLWNAAQLQMIKTGKMHGYTRMYWAKKILEWTPTPEDALSFSIYLNDKYELDGRDPNGYVGCAWSIGGVHDRAWSKRPVFGKIRYMSYKGCKRKFDVKRYIDQYL